MCDFNVGDEVVKYRDVGGAPNPNDTTGDAPIGHVGTVIAIDVGEDDVVIIDLDNWPVCPFTALRADEYRKVVRKNDSLSIEAFLTIKPGFEEPKRAPVKKVPA